MKKRILTISLFLVILTSFTTPENKYNDINITNSVLASQAAGDTES
jgi:hypothetical protein